MKKHVSYSAEETMSIGSSLGGSLQPNDIICFSGELGAGKTTFIKGLVFAITRSPHMAVNSPTFTYLNIYGETLKVYHFDLYRLRDLNDFVNMGFDELLFAGGICCIEWSERIAPLLPLQSINVRMTHRENENIRHIEIEQKRK